MPLGSLLGRLMLVLEASKTRKVWFLQWKITLFANVVFQSFEALEVLLGSSLVPCGGDLDPKWPTKKTPEFVQQVI